MVHAIVIKPMVAISCKKISIGWSSSEKKHLRVEPLEQSAATKVTEV